VPSLTEVGSGFASRQTRGDGYVLEIEEIRPLVAPSAHCCNHAASPALSTAPDARNKTAARGRREPDQAQLHRAERHAALQPRLVAVSVGD